MRGPRFARFPPSGPFNFLVAHFVARLFAGEDEQAAESMSLGLGAVLALLASPGAFASLFLMDKYSPLLHWLRGIRHFDLYRASISDEYFFIVLSMTVTGLVTVLRWNRLLPDRRDFANLAVLPIPIRNIFLAHFTALFGLSALFTVDVNAVACLLFPLIVTMTNPKLPVFLHIATSHAAAVFSASLFSFFGIFALTGVLMLLVPKRWFRLVSMASRILLIVVLLTQFFSNFFLGLLGGGLANRPGVYARFLPSFWFLGLYERIAGLGSFAMTRFASVALFSLIGCIITSIVAYSLCYRRHFLRLAESLDVVGSSRVRLRLHFPDALSNLLFHSKLERACNSFTMKSLFRSERHLMFFGAYLGIGLVIVAQTAYNGAAQSVPGAIPDADLLAVPLMIAFFLITALRFVFDMPAALNASWIFRLYVEKADPLPGAMARRLILRLVLPCEILLLTPFTAHEYGWTTAWMHTTFIVVVTVFATHLLSIHFRKIPFTCSKEPDMKHLLVRILGSIFGVLVAVPMLAGIEHWMLLQPTRLISAAVFVAVAWICLQRYERSLLPEDRALLFEERAGSSFELLKLG